jgi:hypothetical protein
VLLSDYVEALAWETAFWMQALTSADYPIAELGKLSIDISDKLRTLAIIALLAHADTDRFHHNLIRSGRTREAYLSRVRNAGLLEDHHRASGRVAPLMDALASGELALVRRIVALSPTEWLQGHEYEDDYCYAQLVHGLLDDASSTTTLQPILDRFDGYLDGKSSARLDVCRALAARDQAEFDRSFGALLEERELLIESDRRRGRVEEPEIVAQHHVFVEGLAVLRLAEQRGLVTEPDYPYCPSLARVPMIAPFVED